MLKINNKISIPDSELEISAIHAAGPGGQNVNKVATAIHLRFDIRKSSLPDEVKSKVFALKDHRVTAEGIAVIKARRFRSQEKNRSDALERLKELILKSLVVQKKRRPTRPTKASKTRRLDTKSRRSKVKSLRGKKIED